MLDTWNARSSLILMIAAVAMPLPALAQVVPNSPGATPEATTASSPAPQISLPTIATLTAQRQAAAQDTELDEPTRALLDQHFAKALEHLQAVEQADRRIAALAQELEVAPQRVAELQERLGTPLTFNPSEHEAGAGDSLETLNARLKEAENSAAAAQQRLQEITAEIERRSVRRPQLADLTVQTEQQLQELAQQLSAPPPEGEHPQVGVIRTIRLQCRQLRLRRELALFEQESRTFEGTARYWTLQRDLAERDVREAERIVQHWQQQTAQVRRRQAEAEARDARRASAQSHESLRNEADRNSELADENTRLVEALQQTQVELDRLDAELEERALAFESLRKRAEAAEFSPAIGVLLRNQRSALPDRDELHFRIRARQGEISSLNLKLMEWDAERKPLIDLATATSNSIKALASDIWIVISQEDLQGQVQVILSARLKLLGDLIDNGNSQLDQLVRLDSQEKLLLATVDAGARWLAEHVLWVRSTGILGTQPKAFVASATTLLDQPAWSNIRRTVFVDLSEHPWWWGTSALGLLGVLLVRRRAKQPDSGARRNCRPLELHGDSAHGSRSVAEPAGGIAVSFTDLVSGSAAVHDQPGR